MVDFLIDLWKRRRNLPPIEFILVQSYWSICQALLAWLTPLNSYLEVHRLDKPIVVRVPVVLFQRWYKFEIEVSDDSGDELGHFEH